MKRLLLGYIPLALWAIGVLFVGSLRVGAGGLPPGSDKAVHFVFYAIGGALAAWAGRWSGSGAGWPGFTFVVLVALTDELRQAANPWRTGDPLDFAADVLGALTAFVLLGRLQRAGAEET